MGAKRTRRPRKVSTLASLAHHTHNTYTLGPPEREFAQGRKQTRRPQSLPNRQNCPGPRAIRVGATFGTSECLATRAKSRGQREAGHAQKSRRSSDHVAPKSSSRVPGQGRVVWDGGWRVRPGEPREGGNFWWVWTDSGREKLRASLPWLQIGNQGPSRPNCRRLGLSSCAPRCLGSALETKA